MSNNKKPAISVVIPTFNEEKYLANCLKAIRNQTFTDYELIVVDNNSTDKTASIAKKFGARVVKERKQGMIPARERGFREAKAEIIARTDADTIVMPNWLKIIYTSFQKHPKVVAMTGPFLSPSSRIPDKITQEFSYLISVKLGKLLFGHICLLGPNMALRKSAWEKLKVNTDDKKVHEDYDLSSHIAKVGKIIYNKNLKVIFSLRRIKENPTKGLSNYLGEYPIRFIKTLYYNKVGIFAQINHR